MAAPGEKYRTLVELAPDPIFLIRTAGGEIVEVNDSACELLDYRKDDIEGMSVTELHPDDRRADYRQLLERTLEEGEIRTDELPDGAQLFLLDSDGNRIPITLHSRTIELEGDTCVFTIARDVTGRYTYEQELKRKNDRLEEFASTLSHDLRNPLGVAMGHVNLARQEEDSDHLKTAAQALERMETIVDETLDLARRGRMIDEATAVGLATLAQRAWETSKTEDARLEIDLCGDPTFRGDPDRLGHLFENLFRNAVEHGGQSVTVRLGCLSDGFYVADDGPGIPPDERDALFESAGDDAASFGLDIVRRIVEAHGWTVDVTESADGGTRFEFSGVDGETE